MTEPAQPPRRGRPQVPVATIAAVLVTAFVIWWLLSSAFDWFRNPFGTDTVDRSSPVVLKAIQDMRQLRTASGHFEQIIDVEKDTRFVPSVIRGERVLFVAVGNVDAGVDLARVGDDEIDVDEDERSVAVELPRAQLMGVRVNPNRSYVYDRDRGLVDRVASLFQDNPTSERELYVLAEQKLLEAARTDSSLLRRAERNARATLQALLRALGFERIEVGFR